MEALFTNRKKTSRWLAVQFRKSKVSNTSYHRRPWTNSDKQYITDNYTDKESIIRIANHLKRTVIAVEKQIYTLRLLTKISRKPITPKLRSETTAKITRMKELISFLQYTSRVAAEKRYLIETAKQELKKLSGL